MSLRGTRRHKKHIPYKVEKTQPPNHIENIELATRYHKEHREMKTPEYKIFNSISDLVLDSKNFVLRFALTPDAVSNDFEVNSEDTLESIEFLESGLYKFEIYGHANTTLKCDFDIRLVSLDWDENITKDIYHNMQSVSIGRSHIMSSSTIFWVSANQKIKVEFIPSDLETTIIVKNCRIVLYRL
jgi:hypothetical protein